MLRSAPRFRIPVIAACLAAFGVTGCASDPPRPSEDTEAIERLSRVRVVAIQPLTTATAVVDRDRVSAVFGARVEARLEAAGRRVVGPEVWEEIWARYAGDVGDIFDPSTGKADEQRYMTVRDAVVRELADAHGIDGWLRVFVGVNESFGVSDQAKACGGSAPPYWPGGWKKTANHGAVIVRIACLVVVVNDVDGKELFSALAPIEGIETYDRQTRAIRTPDELFQDPALLDGAIEAVLAPFKPTDRP